MLSSQCATSKPLTCPLRWTYPPKLFELRVRQAVPLTAAIREKDRRWQFLSDGASRRTCEGKKTCKHRHYHYDFWIKGIQACY